MLATLLLLSKQEYVSEIAPGKAPRVLDTLWRLKTGDKIFFRVLNAVGVKSPIHEIERQVRPFVVVGTAEVLLKVVALLLPFSLTPRFRRSCSLASVWTMLDLVKVAPGNPPRVENQNEWA